MSPGVLPEYVARGAAHVLVVTVLLVVAYVAKETPRASGLWRRLGHETAEALERGLRRAMHSLPAEERTKLGALSDPQLRDFWLLPALRRVDRAYFTSSRALERAKAVHLCFAIGLATTLGLALRALAGPGVWRSLRGAALAVAAYVALDTFVVSPLMGDYPAEPLREARAAALRRGCLLRPSNPLNPPAAAGPSAPLPDSR